MPSSEGASIVRQPRSEIFFHRTYCAKGERSGAAAARAEKIGRHAGKKEAAAEKVVCGDKKGSTQPKKKAAAAETEAEK